MAKSTHTPRARAKGRRVAASSKGILYPLNLAYAKAGVSQPAVHEVSPEDIPRLTEPQVRVAVVQKLRDLGYLYVTLDLAGYRMGSLNEAVPLLARRAKSL